MIYSITNCETKLHWTYVRYGLHTMRAHVRTLMVDDMYVVMNAVGFSTPFQ